MTRNPGPASQQTTNVREITSSNFDDYYDDRQSNTLPSYLAQNQNTLQAALSYQRGLIYTQAQSQLLAQLNAYSDVPVLPRYSTKYCDLGATSNGTGTVASPYKSSQIAALYTGDMSKKLLAFKRDSVGSSAINFAAVYATAENPFIICPYGDSGELPLIDQGISLYSFVAVNGFSPLYKVQLANYMPIWEDGLRLYNIYPAVPKTPGSTFYNELLAAGPGYMFYGDDGFAYIYPWNAGQNPNLGQMVAAQFSLITAPAWSITIGNNGSLSGNILINGLAATHCAVSGISVNPAAGSFSQDNIRIVNTEVINSGISVSEQYSIYEGSAISLYGKNDSFLLTNGYAAGNFCKDIGNNNVEVQCMDGFISEFNVSEDCIGHGNTELFSTCKNSITQFGQSYFPITSERAGGPNTALGYGNGYRAFPYNFAGSPTNTLTNFNNTLRFELVNNCRGTAVRDDGNRGSRIYNNTLIANGLYGAVDLDFQDYNTGGTVDFSNNIVVLTGTQAEATSGGLFYIMHGIIGTNQITVGDNNNYYSTQANTGSFWIQKGSPSTTYATLALWVTAIGTADKNSKLANPSLNDNGIPQIQSTARRVGHSAMIDPIFDGFPHRLAEQYPVASRNIAQRVTPAAADSVAPNKNTTLLEIIPAGTIATLTVTFPLLPTDGQEFAITTSQIVTTLTMTEPNGYLVKGSISGTALGVGSFAKWRFENDDQFWLRIG